MPVNFLGRSRTPIAEPGVDITVAFDANGSMTIDDQGHRFVNGADPSLTIFKTPSGSYSAPTPSWNAGAKTHTWTYSWGTVTAQFTVGARRVTYALQVNNTNAADIQGLLFRAVPGAAPVTLPSARTGIEPSRAFPYIVPPYSLMSWATGNVKAVFEGDPGLDLGVGLEELSATTARWEFITQNTDAGLARLFTTPIASGTSSPVYTASLRFDEAVADIETTYRAEYPFLATWADNRAIGRYINLGAGTATNPNGWDFKGHLAAIDVTTGPGLVQFRTWWLEFVGEMIDRLSEVGATGALGLIFWQIEGNRSPGFAYVGDPRVFETNAPEWLYETGGETLIDETMQLIIDAGMEFGFCLRKGTITVNPSTLVMSVNRSVDEVQDYIDKITYCKSRFGSHATLYYIDSIDAIESADILEEVQAAHPDVLLLPEHQSVRAYAYSSAYRDMANDFYETDDRARSLYPAASSWLVVSGGYDPDENFDQVVESVEAGDGLMFDIHFQTTGWTAAKLIYAAAGQ